MVTEIERRLPGEPNIGYSEALGEHAANPAAPSEVAADVVHALGHEWKVAPMEQRIKAQFEQKVRREAVAAIDEVEAEGNPERSRKMMAAYISERSAGAYNWDGSACRAARGELTGLYHLFYLLLRRAGSVADGDEATAVEVFKANPTRAVQAIHWAVGNEVQPAKKPVSNGRLPPTMD